MGRRSALRRVGLLILGVNLALALAKGGVWWYTGSLAVGSEAVNSVADTAYSLVIVAGLYLTTRPPDFEHPHGHERIEPFVSLLVAVGIVGAAGFILWQAATALYYGPIAVARGPAAVGVLAVSAAVKYGLYRYCLAVGRDEHSPAVIATAKDDRTDVATALAALAGVAGAALGVPILDPLAAVVVAAGILYTGYDIARSNLDYLVGAAPPEDLRSRILQRALDHPEVHGAHDVVAHYVGPEIDVSLHVEVEGTRTLREAHDIESAVVDAIEELPAVDDAFVHVDPRELGEWKDDADVERLAGEYVERPAEDGADRSE